MKSAQTPVVALCLVSSLALAAAGCGNKKAPAEPVPVKAEPAAAAPAATAKAPLPGDKAVAAAAAKAHEGHDHAGHDHAGHDHAGHDHGGGAPPAGPTCKVLETIDAGTYTYLRINSSQGEIWAAVPAAQTKVGDTVTVAGAMEMKNFKSKTLDRSFPSIWFGTLGGAAPAPAAAGKALAKTGEQRAKTGEERAKAGALQVAPVAKAEGPGAVTVAELWASRKELAGKQVTLRAKVVRYSANIMGSNWLHLQDGSGKAEDKTHDVTATSKTSAAVGDVLVVSGVVAIDRNIGAGYNYPVLIENAALTR